jgi:diaminopimelate decarboxylase
MSHKEGAQGALGQEWGALLRRNVLTAAQATVDLEVQGFAFLLGSEQETEKEEKKIYPSVHRIRPSLQSAMGEGSPKPMGRHE